MLDFGFYNMDCMEGMKEFPDKYFDLAIVDPPYGINVANHKDCTVIGGSERPFGGKASCVWGKHKSIAHTKYYHTFADETPPGEDYFKELNRVSKNRIIWGGNYMLDHLGKATCMIIWDKKRRGLDQADCEIAWTDLKGQSRIYEFRWNGMLQEDMRNKEKRIHPTQKPVALYEWILNRYTKEGDIILDTHVGSASSLIACRNTNHKYVGFEIDSEYYRLAKERLDQETAQMNIFDYMEGK